jgi:hypothetical protein
MPTFAFYPDAPEKRRADGINLAIAAGANETAARAVAQTLTGVDLSTFVFVELTDATPPFVTQGTPPVGGRNQVTWTKLTRGGDHLPGG